ncbi:MULTISPECIES: heparinase II/III family protein [unclassified Paracoccus (in: a-proteobacteria)]|uniref:heparinase II/III family protein n=1 Tax=unclassified Paracoccus (in: a-proteobacteria) TaxID=2688777 RepID=UPI0021E19157|nr:MULTISPECIES: heparinase II/III family protein [unclassified Paracoccus (in: a-proteobacteria)]UXU75826.1 heparinase II/III family protein [Paracoccus sp. SMMA_5]UXU81735.1 heparinase II/III family protein [Paracoccus sp. SMMA_5_TC]
MTDTTLAPPGFLRRPEPKAIGHAGRGEQIVAGVLHLGGMTLTGDFMAAALPPTLAGELHGFGWLDDLAALGTPPARAIAQEQVLLWLRRHPQPQPQTPEWAPEIAGRRLLRWVFHAGMILPGLDRDGARPYFRGLDLHLGHLRDSWYDSQDGLARLEALAGLAIAALHLRERQALAGPALTALAEEAEAMGLEALTESRAPETLLEAMALLVWAREVAEEAGQPVPTQLMTMIGRIAPILRALRHADGGLPCFHGGGRGAPGRLDRCLRAAPGPALPAQGLAMGYARMARGRSTLILDAASPPAGPSAATAHASTLGFELTVQRQPLIVNCGPGGGFGATWARASRATASHSALCLAGLSSSRLKPDLLPGEPDLLTARPELVWAGDCDALGNLTAPDCGPAHAPHPAHLLAGHDGWLQSHGLTHLRELWLEPDGLTLRGEDSLAALDASAQARLERLRPDDGLAFDLHFHLHPEISAETESGGVRLLLPDGQEWRFNHDGVGQARLEPSCLLDPALPAPRPSLQIVLSARLLGRAIQIGWTLARSGAR